MNAIFHEWTDGYRIYFQGANIGHCVRLKSGWWLVTNNQCRMFRTLATLENSVNRTVRSYLEARS